MAWQFTVWIPPLFVTALLTLWLAGQAFKYYRYYPSKTYLKAFAVSMLAIAAWELLSVVVEATTLLELKLLAYNLNNAIFVPLVLYGILWFSLMYTGNHQLVDRRVILVAAIHISIATLAVALWPTVFYDVHLATATQPTLFGLFERQHVIAVRDFNFPFLAFQLYAYGLMLVAAAVIGRFLFRQRDRVYTGQAVALIIGYLSPVVANLLFFLQLVPTEFQMTELTLFVTGVCIGIAVFRYRLLDLVPIARRGAIEEMRDGFVVCNEQHVVLDYNPRGGEIIGAVDNSVTGEQLSDLLPEVVPLLYSSNSTDEVEFETTIQGEQLYLHAFVSRIEDGGRLLSFRDITERKRYESNLEEQNEKLELVNRMVRHDIGNDMTVIAGNLRLLEGHVDDDGQEYLDTALQRGRHVQELTAVLRDLMTTMLEDGAPLKPIELDETLLSSITDIESSHEDASVTVADSLPDVSVTANEMLVSVFDNLIRNAITHNDKSTPEVTISATVIDDSVAVHIADNGPGIPESVRESMFEQGEKGLDSTGTGIGLYLVDTLVRDFGGSVRVADNEPEGTVFTIELPIAEQNAAEQFAEQDH